MTPVKSLQIVRRPSVTIDSGGVRGDRSLLIVDERLHMVNVKRHPVLNQVVAEMDGEGALALTFPGGRRVEAPVCTGESLEVTFYSQTRAGREVQGPFSAALSEHVGRPLRLVAFADGTSAVDRGAGGAVTIVSQSSVEALAAAGAAPGLDPRRFRMTIELAGPDAFAEDAWVGRELRVGSAALRVGGHVGRCTITHLHPETGEADVRTLEILRGLRDGAATTEPLALGVYCSVLSPGTVRVGDPVELGGRA